MANLDNVLKSRAITLPTKVHIVKTMVFPVVMYGCESWTINKAEHWRTDVLKLWCWRRFLRVPWSAGRSNELILKEISPEYLLEGMVWSPCCPRESQETSPAQQFESINSLVLCLLYGPAFTSVYDYWKKNRSLDYMDLCWQSDGFAF